MSSSDPIRRLGDIVRNIDAIAAYTAGLSEAEYRSNQLVIDATERCLLRISEAAVKLDSMAERLAPEMPWAGIRGIGNWLRHGYDEINQDVIWEIVSRQLQSLRESAARAIAQIEAGAPAHPAAPPTPAQKSKRHRKSNRKQR